VDPRLLLGVGPRAGRTEVRAAHRRLRAAVDPARGGTSGLADLIDAAQSVLTTGRGLERLAVDPHLVLGVGPTAAEDEVHDAYRRLARVVHPDRGGTDELFRVVAAAHDVLTGVLSDRDGRRSRRRPTTTPPPPSSPTRGPYRAPPPEERHGVSISRAWQDLAQDVGVLLAAVAVIVAAATLGWGAALVSVFVVAAWSGTLLRPAVDGALRAIVVLLGSRVRVASEIEPERFLEDRCLDAPVGRQDEEVLYDAYVAWCRTRGEPVPPWIFVERLRGLGLLLVKASAWDHGLWVGVVLRR
jgi:hypothetical protein